MKAFPITAALERGKYVLRVDVMPGHYLYRDRFELSIGGRVLANLSLPKKQDETGSEFRRVEIYDQPLQLVAASPARRGGLKLSIRAARKKPGLLPADHADVPARRRRQGSGGGGRRQYQFQTAIPQARESVRMSDE